MFYIIFKTRVIVLEYIHINYIVVWRLLDAINRSLPLKHSTSMRRRNIPAVAVGGCLADPEYSGRRRTRVRFNYTIILLMYHVWGSFLPHHNVTISFFYPVLYYTTFSISPFHFFSFPFSLSRCFLLLHILLHCNCNDEYFILLLLMYFAIVYSFDYNLPPNPLGWRAWFLCMQNL